MKKPLLFVALLMSALPSVAATQRAIYKLPDGASLETLRLMPNGKLALYWQEEKGTEENPKFLTERILIDGKSGRFISKNFVGTDMTSSSFTDIDFETFNSRGQHAYLPYNYGSPTYLRLKIGNNYRALTGLPPFYYSTYHPDELKDMRFSPDGEVLKVLGRDRLWIVGAQTGKLLKVIRPSQGKWWSRENAVLSPDGFTILGMREKMTLFSARSGRLINTYGVHIESYGGEADMPAYVWFSPDGKSTYAYQPSLESSGTTFEYPAMGGKLIRKGNLPHESHLLPDGRFYLAYVTLPNKPSCYPVVKHIRTHKVAASLPDIRFDDIYGNAIEFSSDGKSIYFVKDNTLWQRPFKTN